MTLCLVSVLLGDLGTLSGAIVETQSSNEDYHISGNRSSLYIRKGIFSLYYLVLFARKVYVQSSLGVRPYTLVNLSIRIPALA
jgi:hypothetical protein